MKKYNDTLKFKEKDNLISSNFNDNMYEEIYPIINSNNSIPDIIECNFLKK
jgi:hypothetical protein